MKGPAELAEHQVAKVDDKCKVGSTAFFVEDEELLAADTQPIKQGQNQLNHLCVILLEFVGLLNRNILIQLFVDPFLFFGVTEQLGGRSSPGDLVVESNVF